MKKKLMLLMALVVGGVSMAFAYDFEVEGVYYSVLSETERTVAVVCGNTTPIGDTPAVEGMARGIMYYDYMGWQGNSYSGDVVIPERVQAAEGESPYTVTTIGMGAFYKCSDLMSVQLPETLRSVEVGAFSGCNSLAEVIIPDAVESVGENAFQRAKGLKFVHFPASTKYLIEMTFDGAGSSEGFEIEGTENVTIVSYNVFQNSTLKKFPVFKNLEYMEFCTFANTLIEEVDFPAGCIVGNSIFEGCKYLRSVTIPCGMLTPEKLFYDNPALSLIRYYEPVPPAIEKDIAKTVAADCVLEVPEESVDAYKQAPYWKNFKEIRAITTGSVDSAVDSDSFRVAPGCVVIASGEDVRICDMSGSPVYSGGAGTVELPSGLYILSINGIAHKIAVR